MPVEELGPYQYLRSIGTGGYWKRGRLAKQLPESKTVSLTLCTAKG